MNRDEQRKINPLNQVDKDGKRVISEKQSGKVKKEGMVAFHTLTSGWLDQLRKKGHGGIWGPERYRDLGPVIFANSADVNKKIGIVEAMQRVAAGKKIFILPTTDSIKLNPESEWEDVRKSTVAVEMYENRELMESLYPDLGKLTLAEMMRKRGPFRGSFEAQTGKGVPHGAPIKITGEMNKKIRAQVLGIQPSSSEKLSSRQTKELRRRIRGRIYEKYVKFVQKKYPGMSVDEILKQVKTMGATEEALMEAVLAGHHRYIDRSNTTVTDFKRMVNAYTQIRRGNAPFMAEILPSLSSGMEELDLFPGFDKKFLNALTPTAEYMIEAGVVHYIVDIESKTTVLKPELWDKWWLRLLTGEPLNQKTRSDPAFVKADLKKAAYRFLGAHNHDTAAAAKSILMASQQAFLSDRGVMDVGVSIPLMPMRDQNLNVNVNSALDIANKKRVDSESFQKIFQIEDQKPAGRFKVMDELVSRGLAFPINVGSRPMGLVKPTKKSHPDKLERNKALAEYNLSKQSEKLKTKSTFFLVPLFNSGFTKQPKGWDSRWVIPTFQILEEYSDVMKGNSMPSALELLYMIATRSKAMYDYELNESETMLLYSMLDPHDPTRIPSTVRKTKTSRGIIRNPPANILPPGIGPEELGDPFNTPHAEYIFNILTKKVAEANKVIAPLNKSKEYWKANIQTKRMVLDRADKEKKKKIPVYDGPEAPNDAREIHGKLEELGRLWHKLEGEDIKWMTESEKNEPELLKKQAAAEVRKEKAAIRKEEKAEKNKLDNYIEILTKKVDENQDAFDKMGSGTAEQKKLHNFVTSVMTNEDKIELWRFSGTQGFDEDDVAVAANLLIDKIQLLDKYYSDIKVGAAVLKDAEEQRRTWFKLSSKTKRAGLSMQPPSVVKASDKDDAVSKRELLLQEGFDYKVMVKGKNYLLVSPSSIGEAEKKGYKVVSIDSFMGSKAMTMARSKTNPPFAVNEMVRYNGNDKYPKLKKGEIYTILEIDQQTRLNTTIKLKGQGNKEFNSVSFDRLGGTFTYPFHLAPEGGSPLSNPANILPIYAGTPSSKFTNKGMVTSEVQIGRNFVKDIGETVQGIYRGLIGGRTSMAEKRMAMAIASMQQELSNRAKAKGGNAVANLKVDYEMISQTVTLTLIATADAIKMAKPPTLGGNRSLPNPNHDEERMIVTQEEIDSSRYRCENGHGPFKSDELTPLEPSDPGYSGFFSKGCPRCGSTSFDISIIKKLGGNRERTTLGGNRPPRTTLGGNRPKSNPITAECDKKRGGCGHKQKIKALGDKCDKCGKQKWAKGKYTKAKSAKKNPTLKCAYKKTKRSKPCGSEVKLMKNGRIYKCSDCGAKYEMR